jgi:hypothetical protein
LKPLNQLLLSIVHLLLKQRAEVILAYKASGNSRGIGALGDSHMRSKSVALSAVILVALILIIQPSIVSGVESGVTVPVSTETVTLDGKWTTNGEWQDV